MSTEYELASARWAVRVAVMDLVAFNQHDWRGTSDSAHADHLDEMLDEALKEYAEVYMFLVNSRAETWNLWKEAEAMRNRLEEGLDG